MSLVAERDGDVAGHVLFSRGWLDAPRQLVEVSVLSPDEALQVVRLSAYEPWMTGTVVYPDVFWRHDAVGLRD